MKAYLFFLALSLASLPSLHPLSGCAWAEEAGQFIEVTGVIPMVFDAQRVPLQIDKDGRPLPGTTYVDVTNYVPESQSDSATVQDIDALQRDLDALKKKLHDAGLQ